MWQTIGHVKPVNVLRRSLEQGRIAHAYLLAGPPQVGKMTLALDLAQALNCVEDEKPCGSCSQCSRISRGLHADVQVIGLKTDDSGDGRRRAAISIDQVREVQREASLKPYEGSYRVFIFDGAEQLSEEAVNCLLKTLEEPPQQVVLLLLTSNAGALLPTLVSRCQLLELRPVPSSIISQILEDGYKTEGATAQEIARLSQGRPGWAVTVASSPAALERLDERLGAIEEVVKGGHEVRFAYAANLATSFGRDRESARQELAVWLAWWRDVLLVKEGTPKFVTHLSRMKTLQAVADALTSAQIAQGISGVQETVDYLDRNVNPRLALEELMLTLARP